MPDLKSFVRAARGKTEPDGEEPPTPAAFSLHYPSRGICERCQRTTWFRRPDAPSWSCLSCEGPEKLPTFAIMDRDGWQMCVTHV